MQIEIRSLGHRGLGAEELLLKVVHWPWVPRVGDLIEPWDGWASAEVEKVVYLHDGTVRVFVPPDATGEYAAELAVQRAQP